MGISLAILILPRVARGLSALVLKPRESGWRGHILRTLRQQAAPLAQFALAIVFLPYEATVFLDAIARVLWRKSISRRLLLEWRVSSDVERSARWIDLLGLYIVRCGWVRPSD